MSEIFVEEENTVYELDSECLKKKEEQQKKKEMNHYQIQKTPKDQMSRIWVLCFLLIFLKKS